MSGILILILRIFLAICLYGFLIWAMLTIWRELHAHTQLIHPQHTPILRLSILEGAPPQQKELALPEIILGRDLDNHFPLNNETVSARHARISFHHNQWWVEDLQTTNGTYLNDQRIEAATVLVNGDELRCGQVVLSVDIKP
jgi:hypothetical protein